MSALEDDSINKFWQAIEDHVEAMREHHLLGGNRANQQIRRMQSVVREALLQRLNTNEAVQTESTLVEKQLRSGQLTSTFTAQRVMETFDQGRASNAGLANQVQKGVGFSSQNERIHVRLLGAVMGRTAAERVSDEVESVNHRVGKVLVGLRVEARRTFLAGLHHIDHA